MNIFWLTAVNGGNPHVSAIVVAPFNCPFLAAVDPVDVSIHGVVVDGLDVPQTLEWQDDVGRVVRVEHHAIYLVLLGKQQKRLGS